MDYNIVIYSIITSISLYLHYLMSETSTLSSIKIASDDPQYKHCIVFMDSNMGINMVFIITFIINEGLISGYLLSLLYSKTRNLTGN